MHDDHQPIDAELEKLLAKAKGGRLSQWIYKRNRAIEEMYVRGDQQTVIRRAQLGLVARMVLMFTGMILIVLGDVTWWQLVGALLLVALSSTAITANIFRAHAFRNGYLARGNVDIEAHKQVCGDPVAWEEFQHQMLRIDAATMRWL